MSELNPRDALAQTLLRIENQVEALFAGHATEHALREANAKLAGPKGELTLAMKVLPSLPKEDRREAGQQINAVKAKVEAAFEQALLGLKQAKRKAELEQDTVDVTLPGRSPQVGRVHPLRRVMYDLIDVFGSLGFEVAEGPEVDLATYNFDKLGFPPDHPATDMQDSFYIQTATDARALLRTHTSTVQVREMLRRKTPPMAVVSPGAVYRRDDDVTHSPMFFQIEGFLVDEGVTFAHLKGVLARFVERMFGSGVPVRVRPSYFPFVEPGGEVDIGCTVCRRWEKPDAAPCRVCKSTGWLEILGCGMIHPVVFEHVGIDSEKYSGFAFGLGIDRIAMLRYGLSDIRLLYENDVRFLGQVT